MWRKACSISREIGLDLVSLPLEDGFLLQPRTKACAARPRRSGDNAKLFAVALCTPFEGDAAGFPRRSNTGQRKSVVLLRSPRQEPHSRPDAGVRLVLPKRPLGSAAASQPSTDWKREGGGGEKARHLLPFRDDEGLTPTEARGPQRRRGQSLGGVVSGRPQTSLDETIPRRGIQQGSKLTDSDSSRGGCGAVLGGLG